MGNKNGAINWIIFFLLAILLGSCDGSNKKKDNIISLSGGLWKADIISVDNSLRELYTRWAQAKGIDVKELNKYFESREYALELEFAKQANFLITEGTQAIYKVTMHPPASSFSPSMDDPGINDWVINQNKKTLDLNEIIYDSWDRPEFYVKLEGEIVTPYQFYVDIHLSEADKTEEIILKNIEFNRQGGLDTTIE